MDWFVLSSFRVGNGWIPSLIKSPGTRFVIVDPTYQHDRSRRNAGLRDWRDYLSQCVAAWRLPRPHVSSGFITVFPQLAVVAGVFKRLTFSRKPLVAWMFNLGHTYGGVRGALARFGLSAVNRFVVHSRHEIALYSEWLGLPAERFVFIPLSIDEREIVLNEDTTAPFLLSMGTANRDYALLMRVLADANYPTVVVTGPHALAGLSIPPNVEVRSNLTIDECHALCQRARVSIVPLKGTETASGQVSVLEAMMLGRPVIATRCIGTVDYVENEVDGMLVDIGDAAALRKAIDLLWMDQGMRASLGAAARRSALAKFTFPAVAPLFADTLNQADSRARA